MRIQSCIAGGSILVMQNKLCIYTNLAVYNLINYIKKIMGNYIVYYLINQELFPLYDYILS